MRIEKCALQSCILMQTQCRNELMVLHANHRFVCYANQDVFSMTCVSGLLRYVLVLCTSYSFAHSWSEVKIVTLLGLTLLGLFPERSH